MAELTRLPEAMAEPELRVLSLLTLQGQLIGHDGSTPVVIEPGTPGQVLSVDPSEAPGLKWISPAGLDYGMLRWFATSGALPAGWASPDGSAISRTSFAACFAAVGVNPPWGPGDGSTTFNLPNILGRALVASGTGTKAFAISAVNTGTDVLTIPSNSSLFTGAAVTYSSSGGVATPLVNATTYYVKRLSSTTINLCTTLANAVAGVVINLTAAGSGTQSVTQTLTARTSGDIFGEETHALTAGEVPIHTHTSAIVDVIKSLTNAFGTVFGATAGNTGAAGGSTAHRIEQPSFVANLGVWTGIGV